MSTVAPTLEPRTFSPPGLGLLTRVELRKAADTRAGAWLLGLTALASVLVAVLRATLGTDDSRQLDDVLSLTLFPAGILMPVVGILLITSEWSQRTALSTFALVPDRARVVRAKILAALVLALAAILVALPVAVLATLVGGAADPWSLSAGDVGQGAASVVISLVWGLAFGLVLAAPAPAIVASFVLPTVFTVLVEVVPSLKGTWEWIDVNRPLTEIARFDATATDWNHLAVSGSLWILLPFAAGVVLLLRREVK